MVEISISPYHKAGDDYMTCYQNTDGGPDREARALRAWAAWLKAESDSLYKIADVVEGSGATLDGSNTFLFVRADEKFHEALVAAGCGRQEHEFDDE